MNPLTAKDIELFTLSSKGAGRANNDSSNKRREFLLVELFNKRCELFFSDPTYGTSWSSLNNAFGEALKEIYKLHKIETPTRVQFQQRAGRKYNFDFLMTIHSASLVKLVHLEFKFGGTSVANLPEFFNPSADKEFHDTLYAAYYYKNYLKQVAHIYNLSEPLPSEEEYLRVIHQNTPNHAFLKALDTAEREGTSDQYEKKRVLVRESIQGFLSSTSETTNITLISSELKRSQGGKHYLIYESGKFHIDRIDDSELEIEKVARIKNGNTLVLQTKASNTEIHMLLRWKNHLGVLFPAWQISLLRKE
jgi:hypothetical protein